jgi:hypothetical protein
MDWKRELVIAHLVKQKVAEVDVNQLFENTLPEVAATEGQLQSIEARLDFPLDPQYRGFLSNANGWRAFWQTVDIFGVDDFLGGARAQRASDLVESLEDLQPLCGFDKRDLLPIAVASKDIDVMVMTRPHTATPGQVFWLAGGLIERFVGFEEWFLAMVDYLRADYQSLSKNHH